MKYKYDVLRKLNLIDRTDELLRFSARNNIKKLIKKKRRYLRKKFQIYNSSAMILQSFFRRISFTNNLKDHKHRKKRDSIHFANDHTLLGTDIKDIPQIYFYYFTSNNINHAFDIRELKKCFNNNNDSCRHPYTQEKISIEINKQVNRIIRRLEYRNVPTHIPDYIPQSSILTTRMASLHYDLLKLNVYSDIDKFYKFDVIDYVYFLEDLTGNILLNEDIDDEDCDDIVEIYEKSQKHYHNKYKEKCLHILIDIINGILNTEHDRETKALAISELIDNYNFNH